MNTTDKERIELLIKHLKLSKNALGLAIGEVNGSKFNHIINGRNGISEKLATKINTVFPEVNYEWLVYGTSSMLKTTTENYEKSKEVFVKTITGELIDINTIIDIIKLNQEKFDNHPRYIKHLDGFKSSVIIEYQEKLLLAYQKEKNSSDT